NQIDISIIYTLPSNFQIVYELLEILIISIYTKECSIIIFIISNLNTIDNDSSLISMPGLLINEEIESSDITEMNYLSLITTFFPILTSIMRDFSYIINATI